MTWSVASGSLSDETHLDVRSSPPRRRMLARKQTERIDCRPDGMIRKEVLHRRRPCRCVQRRENRPSRLRADALAGFEVVQKGPTLK